MKIKMDYTLDDITVLEQDTNDDPRIITPKIELPGEIYNQDYPKRVRHTFPDEDKWTKTVEFKGQNVPRWKKYIYQNYFNRD